jgi:UDP-N-acetylglucosamine diphosphorylase / glucose-1-phosphate thymidylyltransferase / UDP-N-acetylgalactosamine diphosphorylase / glucosamine-1-phosphate N-acetyltransferase / galactosamine-1-phosphate N-acetyltransferase
MQAVILAAGEGRRVRPLTRGRPKALIPVANRPIITYVIDALIQNGIRDIIVVVGYRKEQVTRYLNQLEYPVDVVVQDKQLGTAHALKCAEPNIKGDFLLLPGDNYIDAGSVAKIRGTRDAMLVKEHPSPSNFGVVLMKEGHVTRIIEKPARSPSFMVSTGIFSLTPSFFPYIRDNDITDAVTCMLNEGGKILGVVADDWQDAIYPWDLLKMNAHLLSHITPSRHGTSSRNTVISGSVQIGKGTTIGPNTVISGPVIIGNDCEIGPNCCILPDTSIGARVKVEPLCCIGNALIMDDCSIGSHSRILDAVLGEGCLLSDHTSTCTSASLMEIEGAVIKPEFGAILGDEVQAGAFTTFKNCIVGNNATVGDGNRVISSFIPDDSLVI